ncbi:flagellar motor protein MotB [Paenibacillus sacheonensis]|uniref:Flagellar motor protein MotB n=1 Tax=Paenibacillus sacheonensis TaxID=742054 RepID=A0A7X4YRV3_9BACL|nr:flagellar motor protein MotB [Paenibacillus sacheonensis]MBM7567484.1 chemotaxis protein MotB [Paenibacillus sacheonensis]NBC71411.1 flagellar motor protein MotB [Paenibacillus sacheonensis]
MSKRHKKEEHEEHADETWLIPYADLLTLLLALFIVLYAMSSTDSKKFQDMSKAFNVAFNSGMGVLTESSVIARDNMMQNANSPKRYEDTKDMSKEQREALKKQEQEDLEKLKKQVDQYINTNGLTTQLDTKLNQSQLTITISDSSLFAPGSARVKPESRKLAVAISNMLTKYSDYEVIVSGHTDNVPINNAEFESNWELSSMRAIRFMNIVLDNKKLNPKNFSNIGYGEYHPIAGNDTAAGRSKNRRVEVSIIRKFADDGKSVSVSAATANP